MADQEDIDVDKLLEEVENQPSTKHEMEGGEIPPEAVVEPEKPTWNGEEWAFESNGKRVIPESRDAVIKWANQGYGYSQKMGALNQTHAQRMAEIDQRAKAVEAIEKRFSPYAKVEEYAQKNADWWAHVNQQYEQKQREAQNPGLDPKVLEAIKPLTDKLTALEQADLARQQEAAQAAELERVTKEDQTLDQEIKSIRDQHPNIDFSVKDETGEPLERRILLHAEAN